jgi:hypothetical protein
VQAKLANACKGAVVKSYGAERLQCMSVVKLNASEPLMTCRKRKDDVKTVGGDILTGARCNIQPVKLVT